MKHKWQDQINIKKLLICFKIVFLLSKTNCKRRSTKLITSGLTTEEGMLSVSKSSMPSIRDTHMTTESQKGYGFL